MELNTESRLVVKLGGSLYDHPQLVPGVHMWLATREESRILIVAGGGVLADAIRELDRWQNLGHERSHFYALQATQLATMIFGEQTGLPIAPYSLEWWDTPAVSRVQLLNSDVFLQLYEAQIAAVPHTWGLTTDSIAAYAAGVANCPLVLLKSVDMPPETSWQAAADAGWVDPHFPGVLAKYSLVAKSLNFRRWLDGELPQVP